MINPYYIVMSHWYICSNSDGHLSSLHIQTFENNEVNLMLIFVDGELSTKDVFQMACNIICWIPFISQWYTNIQSCTRHTTNNILSSKCLQLSLSTSLDLYLGFSLQNDESKWQFKSMKQFQLFLFKTQNLLLTI